MQPISNRLITSISAGTPYERALNRADSPIEEGNSAVALKESGVNLAAESAHSPPLTNSVSETRVSSGIVEGNRLSLETSAKPDVLSTMNPDDFLEKLNNRTLSDGPILVTVDLTLTDDDALANLPAGLAVGSNLSLENCTSLTSLPAGFTVGGNLDLRGCTSLTSLPAGLNVGGDLNLSYCTSLTSLPEGLNVGGDLDLWHCKSLTSLPEGLTLGGELDLSGCTSLTSLPEGLNVGGSLNLRGCTLLTSLPTGLTVLGNLCLSGCTSLTSLPEGLTLGLGLDLFSCTSLTLLPAGLNVGVELHLEGCTSLTLLPAELTVGSYLNLKGCISLTSLPAGLIVGSDLNLKGCTSLTSLPAGLNVGRDLDLGGCASLTSLPAGLNVGRDLDLEGCTSLTSLPNWITELGPRREGLDREVNLTGTGLSDALIDRLMGVEAPGMRFIFSRQAAPVANAFPNLDAAISFWKALAEDAPSVSLNLEEGEALDLINFLTRLKATAEYQNILARTVLAKRICNVLKKMEDQEFKERTSLLIHEGLSTCHDRIITALDELDLMLQVNEAEEGGIREELRALGKSMRMLEEVQKAAKAHARTLTWVDEIEIQLAFQIGLRDRLQLPLSTGNMIFRRCAHVSDEQIQQVGAEIERIVSEEMVDKYLQTWAPWQKLLRREEFDALNPEFQEAPTDLNWECCLSFDELTEGYLFRGQLYSRDSLRKVYVDKGVDPFTNQLIDLTQVKKVVKSSISLQD